MNEEEVKTVLRSNVVMVSPPAKYQNSYVPLKVLMEIGHYKMEAMLQFALESKRLDQVLIKYPGADKIMGTVLIITDYPNENRTVPIYYT